MSAPLIVTDPFLATQPMTKRAQDQLTDAGLEAPRSSPTSSRTRSRPTSIKGLEALKAGEHDGVVAFGGGSALDAGKVIAFMAGQTRPMWDFEDIGDWWTRADPKGIMPDHRRADDRRHRLRSRPRRASSRRKPRTPRR